MSGRRRLGRSGLEVTPIGLGCWQFAGGRGLTGWFWEDLPQDAVDAIVRAALDGGIDWFDTAEVYGWGRSERALAHALDAAGRGPADVAVATKWWPAFRRAGHIAATIEERRRCLEPYPIALYQVHQPLSFSSVEAQMDSMADLVVRRRVGEVGVSNFSASWMRRAHAALARRGIVLASNQVSYSLIDRRIERNGILAAARELRVSIIAYSPLAQGLLTGKFHDDPALVRGRRGPRRWMRLFRPRGLERTRPLVEELRRVGAAHGATAAQVALRWLTQAHGDVVVAIAGATRPRHAEEAAGAMRFTLEPDEMARIDERSRAIQ